MVLAGGLIDSNYWGSLAMYTSRALAATGGILRLGLGELNISASGSKKKVPAFYFNSDSTGESPV